MGFAPNVGDILTFKILTDDTRAVIYRSVVCPADVKQTVNKHVSFKANIKTEFKIDSDNDVENLLQHERRNKELDKAVVVDDVEPVGVWTRSMKQSDAAQLNDFEGAVDLENPDNLDMEAPLLPDLGGAVLDVDHDPTLMDPLHGPNALEIDNDPTLQPRSRINGLFQLQREENPLPHWLISLLLIPRLILFSTIQVVNYMRSPAFFAPVSPDIAMSLGLEERGS